MNTKRKMIGKTFKITDGLLKFSHDSVNIGEPQDFFVNPIHRLLKSQM